VLRLLNIIATVLPINESDSDIGMEPDLIACLWEAAFRTRAVNSAGVRSAIDRRCRGANGEIERVAGVEYSLRLDGPMRRRALWTGAILINFRSIESSKTQDSGQVPDRW